MSRVLRALTTTTALAVAAAMIPATASIATASDASRTPAPAAAPSGIVIGSSAESSSDFAAIETTSDRTTSARATTWPIGGGKGRLTTHTVEPSGFQGQQISSVDLTHYRAHGGVLEGKMRLRAKPSSATKSVVLIALGRVSSDKTTCDSPAGSNIVFSSVDEDDANNPQYGGAVIKILPFKFPAAAKATWNCAFAKTAANQDSFGTPYDAVGGDVKFFRQKPILSIKVANRRISSQSYTTVPVTITNSTDTVATATNTRLKVTANGLNVRFNPDVGTIKPGASKKGSIKLKYTSKYKSSFTITVRSGDYVKKVTYTVTPVR